jgi:hypothetical protein
MRSPIRALLVALVATLGLVLVAPSIAEAKPNKAHSSKTTTTTKKKTTVKKKTAKSTHHGSKHAAKPWKKDHAKAHPKPQRIRKSSVGKHHPRKG